MQVPILVIDDDILVMEFYIRALEQEGFMVKQFFGPDTTFEFIEQEQPKKLTAIILDIMMLPGKRYQHKDTNQGLRTGNLIYENLRSLYPEVPIIILTNVSNPETLDEFKEGPLLKVVQKLDYPPFELAQLVKSMLTTSTE